MFAVVRTAPATPESSLETTEMPVVGGEKSGAPARVAGGFTYAGVLFAIVILGMTLSAAGTVWSTSAKREREAELVWVGNQYARAIESYYVYGPAGTRQYPRSLEDLTSDLRGPVLRRHMRRLYTDPMTGQLDWQLERLPDGSITGIRSAARGRPLKRKGFGPGQRSFEDAECYCDWVFGVGPLRDPNHPRSLPGRVGWPGSS